MTRPCHRRALIGVLLALLMLPACSAFRDETPAAQMGNDKGMEDPSVYDPGVIAQSVTRLLLTYNPAVQAHGLDVPAQITEQTTGQVNDMLASPTPQQIAEWTPPLWSVWAQAHATVTGLVDTPRAVTDNSVTTVTMTWTQTLSYPDGASSPWAEGSATATVVTDAGRLKVSTLTLDPLPSQPRHP